MTMYRPTSAASKALDRHLGIERPNRRDMNQCRYLNRWGEQCTAESVTPDPDIIQLCTRHLGEALRLLRHVGLAKKGPQR
jgi:hypothetical protein